MHFDTRLINIGDIVKSKSGIVGKVFKITPDEITVMLSNGKLAIIHNADYAFTYITQEEIDTYKKEYEKYKALKSEPRVITIFCDKYNIDTEINKKIDNYKVVGVTAYGDNNKSFLVIMEKRD